MGPIHQYDAGQFSFNGKILIPPDFPLRNRDFLLKKVLITKQAAAEPMALTEREAGVLSHLLGDRNAVEADWPEIR